MKLLSREVNGVKVWFIFLAIIACLIVMAFLLNAPKVVTKLPLVKESSAQGLVKGKVRIDGILFDVLVAQNPIDRQKGLSVVDSLGPREGMLFIFDKNDRYSIWMKDMKFPIDILWISEGGKIVDMKRDATPDSYPATFTNTKTALYVLELPAGSIDTYSFNGLSSVDIDPLVE